MTRPKIAGLDTLRFAAAFCVAMSHGASFPFSAYLSRANRPSHLVLAVNDAAFNGSAAVLVFFVISGFCIHYNFCCGEKFEVLPFLSRRLIRICIPALVAFLLAWLGGPAVTAALIVVLWSLYCEAVYYLLYPLLRLAMPGKGMPALIIASFAISLGLILLYWNFRYYWYFPLSLMWLVPLPAWLLGCLLAQNVASGRALPRRGGVWLWRLGVWGYSVLALLFFYHGAPKMGHPALLMPFGVICYFWIAREIAHYQNHAACAALEWCGKWSYSLYLVHNPVMTAMDGMGGNPLVAWSLRIFAITATALVFYGLIERPSHMAARMAGRRLSARARDQVPGTALGG